MMMTTFSLLPLLILIFPTLGCVAGSATLLLALRRNDVPLMEATHFLFIGNAALALIFYAIYRSVTGTDWMTLATLPEAVRFVVLILSVVVALLAVISLAWFARNQIFPIFYIKSALTMSVFTLLLVFVQAFSTRPAVVQADHRFVEVDKYATHNTTRNATSAPAAARD